MNQSGDERAPTRQQDGPLLPALTAVLRHHRAVLGFTVVTAALVALVAFLQEPRYTASARLEAPEARGALMDESFLEDVAAATDSLLALRGGGATAETGVTAGEVRRALETRWDADGSGRFSLFASAVSEDRALALADAAVVTLERNALASTPAASREREGQESGSSSAELRRARQLLVEARSFRRRARAYSDSLTRLHAGRAALPDSVDPAAKLAAWRRASASAFADATSLVDRAMAVLSPDGSDPAPPAYLLLRSPSIERVERRDPLVEAMFGAIAGLALGFFWALGAEYMRSVWASDSGAAEAFRREVRALGGDD